MAPHSQEAAPEIAKLAPDKEVSFQELALEIQQKLQVSQEQYEILSGPDGCCGGSNHLSPSQVKDLHTRFDEWAGNFEVFGQPEGLCGLDRCSQSFAEIVARLREIMVEIRDCLQTGMRIERLAIPGNQKSRHPAHRALANAESASLPCAHTRAYDLPDNEETKLLKQLLGTSSSSLHTFLEDQMTRLFAWSHKLADSAPCNTSFPNLLA